jgi:hypothetical protein
MLVFLLPTLLLLFEFRLTLLPAIFELLDGLVTLLLLLLGLLISEPLDPGLVAVLGLLIPEL